MRKIAEMQQAELCECGNFAQKVILRGNILPDLPGYECPITGKWIEGRRAHTENLKRHGCRVYEAGETKEFIKNKPKRDEQAVDKMLDRILPKSLGDTIGRQ